MSEECPDLEEKTRPLASNEDGALPSGFQEEPGEKAKEAERPKIFDVRLYRRIWPRRPGVLSQAVKALLALPEKQRPPQGISTIINETDGITFFKKFSNEAKDMLARKLLFVARQKATELLRDGEKVDPEQAMYVIVSGVVSVKCPISSSASSEKKYWPEKMLQRGDCFGYTDLLRNRLPSIDAQTVGYCELLMLKSKDFDIVRGAIAEEDSRLEESLRSIATLTRFGWTEDEFKALQLYAQVVTYGDSQAISRGEDGVPSPHAFFLVDGEGKMVRDVYYVVDSGPGFRSYRTVQPSEFHREVHKIHKRTLEFGRLKRESFFGVGETVMRDRVHPVFSLECLLVPRFLLVAKDECLLQKMATSLSNSLPGDQAIVDHYREMLRWERRKTEIMEEVFKDKPEMRVGHQRQARDDRPMFRKYF